MDWGDNDPVLEERLENWGRWAGDFYTRRGTSPLYRIIEDGMTKEEAEQRARERHVVKIDEKDAKIINNAVLSTPFDTLPTDGIGGSSWPSTRTLSSRCAPFFESSESRSGRRIAR